MQQLQGLVGALGIGAAAGAMISAGKEAIAMAGRQIEAETRLAAVLRATGGSAGFTADQLKKYASDLQNATTTGDEEILESMAIIATFKSISGDAFKRTTEAALDMAAAGFGSAQSSATQLAKAVEDPIRGMTALRRVGVTFSDQVAEQIKSLQQSGNLLAAQEMILSAVEGQLGGVAKAMAKTPFGRYKQLQNALGDVREELGNAVLPLFNEFAEVQLRMTKLVTDAVSALSNLDQSMDGFGTRTALATGGVLALRTALWAASAAAGGLGKALKLMLVGTGFGLFFVLIGAAVAGLISLGEQVAKMIAPTDQWKETVATLQVAWETFKETVSMLLTTLMNTFFSVAESIAGFFGTTLGEMPNDFAGWINSMISTLAGWVADAAEWFQVVVTNWDVVMELMKNRFVLVFHLYKDVFMQLPEIMAFIAGRMVRAMAGFVSWAIETIPKVMKQIGIAILVFFEQVWEGIKRLFTGENINNLMSSAVQVILAKSKSINEALMKGVMDEQTSISDIFQPSEGLKNAMAKQEELLGKLVSAKAELEAKRRSRVEDLLTPDSEDGGKPGLKVDNAVVKSANIKLPTGFVGFTELGKKLQEQMLKSANDPAKKTAKHTEMTALHTKEAAKHLKTLATKETEKPPVAGGSGTTR